MALDYAPNGKGFATGGKDNLLRVYDEETKQIVSKLSGIKWHAQGHNNRIFAVKYKPDDSNMLVSGGWDQNVRFSAMFRSMYGISGRQSLWPRCMGPRFRGTRSTSGVTRS